MKKFFLIFSALVSFSSLVLASPYKTVIVNKGDVVEFTCKVNGKKAGHVTIRVLATKPINDLKYEVTMNIVDTDEDGTVINNRDITDEFQTDEAMIKKVEGCTAVSKVTVTPVGSIKTCGSVSLVSGLGKQGTFSGFVPLGVVEQFYGGVEILFKNYIPK